MAFIVKPLFCLNNYFQKLFLDTTSLAIASITEPDVTTETETDTTSRQEEAVTIVDRCRKYNACVIYLVHEEEDVETEEILAVEAGVTRRSGLSVGTALVTMEQLYEVTMPRNTIATVTISDKGKITPGHYPNTDTYSQKRF